MYVYKPILICTQHNNQLNRCKKTYIRTTQIDVHTYIQTRDRRVLTFRNSNSKLKAHTCRVFKFSTSSGIASNEKLDAFKSLVMRAERMLDSHRDSGVAGTWPSCQILVLFWSMRDALTISVLFYVYFFLCVYVYICVCVCVCMCMCVYMCMFLCVCVCVLCVYVCMCVYVYG